ncbi:MAG: tRNA modification GTPase [Planctomycetes bacterium]|nr:tRNA modification GTPase [Planctomycetota bacterium]
MNVDETIAAIASAPGGAMRGIIRLSGPDVIGCLSGCFQSDDCRDLTGLDRPTVLAGLLQVSLPIGELPCDLYLWPGSRSYTRQPTAELHTIGSPPLLESALATVCAAGARVAEPGEFTMRAFLAGRLDLTQAEAVLGVIDAHSERELDVALSQLAGGLAGPLTRLRNELLDLLADVEAGLDFVEEDIEFISAEQLDGQLRDAAEQVNRLADQMTSRGESTGSFRIALIGWPNVGKSSLMNALAGHRAAIVAETAGTTRDYLTADIEIDGLKCRLIDTAGVAAENESEIAAKAQASTALQSRQAHVQLLCIDATRRINAWECEELERQQPEGRILVLTKTDGVRSTDLHFPAIETSSHTGQGLAKLRQAISQRIVDGLSEETSVVAGPAIRCRESLRLASSAIARAWQAVSDRIGDEIVAAEIRVALDEVGKVVGAVYTDDILDRIFSRFCIGK